MPSDFITNAIVVLLVIIAAGVVWIGFVLSRRSNPVATQPTALIDPVEYLDQIKEAARHYADVSAVVEMIRQLEQMDEDAIALLATYPKQVRAAALLHAANSLGRDLEWAQKELSDANQVAGRYRNRDYCIVSDRKECQAHVETLRGKLDKVELMSRQHSALRSV